jgi:Glycosyl-hydrolase 97 C-terminal, oligomerisation
MLPRQEKKKGSNKWFIGAITDENKREIMADLSFPDKGKKYTAQFMPMLIMQTGKKILKRTL